MFGVFSRELVKSETVVGIQDADSQCREREDGLESHISSPALPTDLVVVVYVAMNRSLPSSADPASTIPPHPGFLEKLQTSSPPPAYHPPSVAPIDSSSSQVKPGYGVVIS